MFKIFDEDGVVPARDVQSPQLDSRITVHDPLSRDDDMVCRKILLPRGPLQAKFGPQPYFYFASKSGAVPSWMIDEKTRKNNRPLLPDSMRDFAASNIGHRIQG